MKILIAGQAKSGTTALYYALKQSLPPRYICLFEPRGFDTRGPERHVLAKALINEHTSFDDFEDFQKKILIVRDPRDNLVSRALYTVYDQKFLEDEGKVASLLGLLERKRRDPRSVPLLEILRLLSDLSGEDLLGRFIRRHRLGLEFESQRPGYFVYKYEDFVAGRFGGLEDYLGLKVRFSGRVDASHARVARTKGSGDWRNWFTPPDVEYFRAVYDEYLLRHGYGPEWELSREPRIAPEHSTEYVTRLVRERRSGK